jgi:uncharacterized protein YoxC
METLFVASMAFFAILFILVIVQLRKLNTNIDYLWESMYNLQENVSYLSFTKSKMVEQPAKRKRGRPRKNQTGK